MNFEVVQKSSDWDGPVLRLIPTTNDELFQFGREFQKLVDLKLCVWKADSSSKIGYRFDIPLAKANALGMPDFKQ